MSSLLVHFTHGPEAATRAALGALVARAATEAGHEVSLFFAGDAASLVRRETADAVHGIGTGAFGENLQALVDARVPIFVSGMSAKARGLSDDDLPGPNAEFAMPAKLVELTMSCDRVLTY